MCNKINNDSIVTEAYHVNGITDDKLYEMFDEETMSNIQNIYDNFSYQKYLSYEHLSKHVYHGDKLNKSIPENKNTPFGLFASPEVQCNVIKRSFNDEKYNIMYFIGLRLLGREKKESIAIEGSYKFNIGMYIYRDFVKYTPCFKILISLDKRANSKLYLETAYPTPFINCTKVEAKTKIFDVYEDFISNNSYDGFIDENHTIIWR